MPFCDRIASTVSPKDMPRGISSRRKSPITSPCSAVFTSSPGMTTSFRPRARSTASSAPPKTLWSVTAIAPRPWASAWSSSSSTSIEQSCDQPVWRWRSATTHSRSASGVRGAGGRAAHVHAPPQPPRQRRARRERARPEQDELPLTELDELAGERTQQRALRGPPLEHDAVHLVGGREAFEVDAEGNEVVVAG